MSQRAKLLVANRSEIACRVFQAAREMGIPTVAIQAPGDEDARHITYADQVVPVAGYLDVAAITQAARLSGATLVHPGYGFLSERAEFAEAIEGAGISFVGPTGATMRLMGGKIAAKDLAEQEGVPTLPWARVPAGAGAKELESAAAGVAKFGYPLLLKAAAGGGGKGMRIVRAPEDLVQGAESATAEAIAAFGDGTLFVEKYVEKPRHIEVQVFGDGRGGGIHLRERECSLQRRHQKVWEEAAAPNLTDATREGLCEAALKLVRKTQYRSAGTVEFLVDENGGFYFLEMNTRLQVEHPVTELVCGVDLVIAQLELALDPKSTPLAATPAARGHAIEVRLYAEDPARGFIPTPGRVDRLRWPTGPGIRVDSGIEEGQAIGTSFDSMLAKLIVHGRDRAHAIARMRFALEETVIQGLGTNQNYLRALADHPAVASGDVYTGFLEKEFAPPPISDDELAWIATALPLAKTGQDADPAARAGSGWPSPYRVMPGDVGARG